MSDTYTGSRLLLRTEGNARRVRAREVREARVVILREFGPAGVQRLETGDRARSLDAWAADLEADAADMFAAADALATVLTPALGAKP